MAGGSPAPFLASIASLPFQLFGSSFLKPEFTDVFPADFSPPFECRLQLVQVLCLQKVFLGSLQIIKRCNCRHRFLLTYASQVCPIICPGTLLDRKSCFSQVTCSRPQAPTNQKSPWTRSVQGLFMGSSDFYSLFSSAGFFFGLALGASFLPSFFSFFSPFSGFAPFPFFLGATFFRASFAFVTVDFFSFSEGA